MTTSQSGGDADTTRGSPAGAPQDTTQPSPGELQKELADVKDQLLRALAEQQNIRRRAQREAQEGLKFAAADLSRDLLATADNLRRAIESAPLQKTDNEAIRQWLAGVTATEKALLDAFARHGIRQLNPIGQTFDPNLHQAVFDVADAEQPAGTIVQVVQPGYMLHDRVLRPAMVGVSRGRSVETPHQDHDAPSTAGGSSGPRRPPKSASQGRPNPRRLRGLGQMSRPSPLNSFDPP
jgi:molecular chaperone GrpE